MTSQSITQLLKAGQEIHYAATDPSIVSALKNIDPVRIRPFKNNETIKIGQIVLQAFGGKTRLRIVNKITGDSCQLKNAQGVVDGWFLKSTIIGVVRDTATV